LSKFYKNESDIQQDFELQRWAKEIVEIGFKGQDVGFPSRLTTVEQLIEVVSIFIYIVSVKHGIVNYPGIESFSWTPFTPPQIKGPLLTNKGKITEKDILNALPDFRVSGQIVALLAVLGMYLKDDLAFGTFPESLFKGEEFEDAHYNLQNRIHEIKEAILKNHPEWDHTLPEKIRNSVSV